MLEEIAASIAFLAVVRNVDCMSIFFERDFSNGDIPLGRGVNCSVVVDDDDDEEEVVLLVTVEYS